jgi:hypothetical protein
MPEPAPPKPARRPLSRQDQRLLWLLVIAAWLAIGAWAVMTFRAHISTRLRALPTETTGEYHRVEAFAAPLALRLDDGRIVRPAGVAVPRDPVAADQASLRLRELVPPGTEIFVEFAPQFPAVAGGGPLPASVWLPPADAAATRPFPYDKSRLVGAILLQEGLVTVDPAQPYMYKNEFEMIEHDARRHGRGLWGSAGGVASAASLRRTVRVVECGAGAAATVPHPMRKDARNGELELTAHFCFTLTPQAPAGYNRR